jgi:FAD/FMN-containing dehydrogenase
MSTTIDTTQLAAAFSGRLLKSTDAGYDEARRVHNGLVDKHPALVARCAGTADIADAVKLPRTLNLEVAVRGGGHNVAGRATRPVIRQLMRTASTTRGSESSRPSTIGMTSFIRM